MPKRILVALFCLFVLASLATGQVKTVNLKDGRQLTGTVKETKDGYEVTTEIGGVIALTKNQVASIETIIAPTDEYLQRRKKIDPNDADARYTLGEWAFRKGLYKIAASELNAAKKLRKNFPKADLLLKQVLANVKISTPTDARPTASGKTATRSTKTGMISARDINRIRLSEVHRNEVVRVAFRKKALDRFIESMRASDDFRKDDKFDEKFRRRRKHLQLDYILNHVAQNAWSLKDDIIIKNDPKTFQEFRRKVWPLLNKGCATSICHGAPKGKGKLKLYGRAMITDVAAYTNFLILDMYAKGGNRMIYRDHADLSLLLDYGLPRKDARSRHPKKGITPIFKNVNDQKYKIVKDWIESLQGPPHPEYNVDFKTIFAPKLPKSPVGTTTKPTDKKTDEGVKPV